MYHDIAPALAAPFMKADGLVQRGIPFHFSPFVTVANVIIGQLVRRYQDGTESPVPVQLKALGDGTVITRNYPTFCNQNV